MKLTYTLTKNIDIVNPGSQFQYIKSLPVFKEWK